MENVFGRGTDGDRALSHVGERSHADVLAVVCKFFVALIGNDEQIMFNGNSCNSLQVAA